MVVVMVVMVVMVLVVSWAGWCETGACVVGMFSLRAAPGQKPKLITFSHYSTAQPATTVALRS